MSNNKRTVLFDIENILRKITIEEGQKVAELGCGNFGFFVWPMAKLVGRHGQVYAVDILKNTLEEIKRQALKENFPQVKTVWSNLEIFKATDIETSSLDCALLINILYQSEKRIEILREAIRLLKRGGKLLIVEWENTDSPLGPILEKRVKLDSLKSVAPKIGLDIRDEFIAGPYHYGIILTKL
jgi:ubiquinone/menaquinone biosynthesis C-methylase UbiE